MEDVQITSVLLIFCSTVRVFYDLTRVKNYEILDDDP